MPQDWVGVRELGRRVGRKHRAVQRAIEEGRIPAGAVRRHPTSGRIVAIEYHAAALAWDSRTDAEMAMRSAEPLRSPPAATLPAARDPYAGLDPYDAETLRFSPGYDAAFAALPAALRDEGLAGEAIDRVLEFLYQVIVDELRDRAEPEEFIAGELGLLRKRITEEREYPGSWTTT